MNGWGTAALVAAVITNGLMAGLFAAYSYAVMPGLGRSDDRTFVEAMQQTNAAILNGWFGLCFGGAVLFAAAAVLLHLGRPGLPWIVAGLVLYVAVLVVTFRVNVPLNDALDAGRVRWEDYRVRWIRWNHVRVVAGAGALALLLAA